MTSNKQYADYGSTANPQQTVQGGPATGASYGTSGANADSVQATDMSTNAGPHRSNLLNKLDPRVDSDRDHRANAQSAVPSTGVTQQPITGENVGGSGYGATTEAGMTQRPITGGNVGGTGVTGATNYGPHSSNLENKLDPRVDSDRDHRANPQSAVPSTGVTQQPVTSADLLGTPFSATYGGGASQGAGATHEVGATQGTGYGATREAGATHGVGATQGTGYGATHTAGATQGTGYGATQEAGYGAAQGVGATHVAGATHAAGATQGTGYGTTQEAGYGATTGAGGVTGATNSGPHRSNLENKLDPRVDSDRDHRANPQSAIPATGVTQQPVTGGNVGGTGYGATTEAGGVTGATNYGPHSSNLANKADPRIDSDRDHRANPTSAVPGTGTSAYDSSTTGYDSTAAGGNNISTTPGSGEETGTTGPHKSSLLNKLDPRVHST